MRSLLGWWVGAVLVLAGPMVGQNRASSSTVLSEIRPGATGTDHVLNVINRSDESIVVTSVTPSTTARISRAPAPPGGSTSASRPAGKP
jgi:hypothetical protein